MKNKINLFPTLALHRAKVFFLCILLISMPFLSLAQEDEKGEEARSVMSENQNIYVRIFTHSYWGVQVGGFMAQKTDIIPTSGPLKMTSRPSPGYYYGLHYVYNLNPSIGLEASIEHGISTWYYSYRFLKSEIPQYPYNDFFDYRTRPIGYWNYSIRPVFRTQLNKTWLGHLKAGLSLRNVNNGKMRSGGSSIDNQGNVTSYFGISQVFDDQPQLDFSFQVGFTHILKNYDLLHFDLVYHFARKPASEGYYRLFPDEPDFVDYYSEGDMNVRGSHVGIQVSYSFSKMGNELRKIKRQIRKNRRLGRK
jgi:hypothetical protein